MMKGTLCLYLVLCTAATLASANYDDFRGKAASRRLMQLDAGQSVTFGRELKGTEDLKNAASRHPLLFTSDDDGPDDDSGSWSGYADNDDDGHDDDGHDDDSGSWSGYSDNDDDGHDDDGHDDDNGSWSGYSDNDDDSHYMTYGRKLEGKEDLGNTASRHPLLYTYGDDDGPDDDGPDDDSSWSGYADHDDDGHDDDNGSWSGYSDNDDDGHDDDGNSWSGYSDNDDDGHFVTYGRKLEGTDLGNTASRHPLLYTYGDDDGPDDDGPDDDGRDDDSSWSGYAEHDDDGRDDDNGSWSGYSDNDDDGHFMTYGRKLEGTDLGSAASRHPLLFASDDDGPDDDGPDDDGPDDDGNYGSSWSSYSEHDDDGRDDDNGSWSGYSDNDDDDHDDDGHFLTYGRKLKGMKNVGQGAGRHPLQHGADDGFGVSGNI